MRVKNGFTLIELLISIVIFSICLVSVVVMFQQALYGGYDTRVLTIANFLAEEKMEEVLTLGYAGVTSVAATNFPSPFNSYTFEVAVHYVQPPDLDTSVDPTVTDYKNVEVKVVKPMPNYNATVTMSSLLTNYIN